MKGMLIMPDPAELEKHIAAAKAASNTPDDQNETEGGPDPMQGVQSAMVDFIKAVKSGDPAAAAEAFCAASDCYEPQQESDDNETEPDDGSSGSDDSGGPAAWLKK
jgi:hypothetical protein